jgi:hypothetical protein
MMAPGVVSALLDLPVEPSKPRPPTQMQELIRWELDPYFSEFNDLWNIGAILQGRGFLTPELRHEIAVELELRHSDMGGGLSLIRFGELAMEMGSVTRNQLDECLASQERMVTQDVTLTCGWHLQQWGGDEDEEAQHAWQVCGIANFRRKQWVGLLAQQGVKLGWFFPHLGALLALLGEVEMPAQERVLLELQQEQVACYRLLGSKLVSQHVIPRPSDQAQLVAACIDLCSEHMRPDVDSILVHGWPESDLVQLQRLGEALNRDVATLISCLDSKRYTDGAVEGNASLYLHALAIHTKQLSQQRAGVRVEAVDPPPPMWKNPEFWRYAAPALLAVGVLSHGIWSHVELYRFKVELAHLEDDREERSQIASSATQMEGEVKRLNDQIRIHQSKLETSIKTLDRLENVLLARQVQVPQFLRGIARSVNAFVVVDAIEESVNPPGFLVQGWAARDASAQEFAKELEGVMADLGYMVAQTEVRAALGRTGVRGYGVGIWLIPIPPEELEGSQVTPLASNKTTAGGG